MSSVLQTASQVGPSSAQAAREGHAPLERRRRWVFWLLGAWLLTGFYLVAPDQQAVVTTWGAVTSPRVLPGLHLGLPWPIQQVYKLKVHQLRRIVIGGDATDIPLGRLAAARSEFLSGDQNLLNVRVVVQYSKTHVRARDASLGFIRPIVSSSLYSAQLKVP